MRIRYLQTRKLLKKIDIIYTVATIPFVFKKDKIMIKAIVKIIFRPMCF